MKSLEFLRILFTGEKISEQNDAKVTFGLSKDEQAFHEGVKSWTFPSKSAEISFMELL